MTPNQKAKVYTAAIERLLLDKHKGYKTVGAVAGGALGAGIGSTAGLAKTINRHRAGELDELDTVDKAKEYLKAMGSHAGIGLGAGSLLGAGVGELGRRWTVSDGMSATKGALNNVAKQAPENISAAGKHAYRKTNKETASMNISDNVKQRMMELMGKKANVSPSKLVQEALRKRQIQGALIGGIGGGIGNGLLAAATPNEDGSDTSALERGLTGAGIGTLAGGALGYGTGTAAFRNFLSKHRTGMFEGLSEVPHDKGIKEKAIKAREAYNKKHNVHEDPFAHIMEDVLPPNRGQRGHHLADELARNAAKRKPDSVEDVIQYGYRASKPKFTAKEKQNAIPTNFDAATGTYSNNIPKLK